jgi:Asp/Glu/hydantoin racemase
MNQKAEEIKVGFIHTTPPTIAMVDTFVKALLPGIKPVHMYDGSVKIDNFNSTIGTTPKRNLLRWATFADQLERTGCKAIVSCCSLMPRATAFAKQVVSVPMVQLDAVILDEAVAKYRNIGIITTSEYTVPYVQENLDARAANLGVSIRYSFSNTPKALDLFNAGDFEEHDRLIIEDIRGFAAQGVDCVLMGQIPFAMMDEKLKALDIGVPILYAGSEAFLAVGKLLEQGR